ncbi:interleukin-2 receptor subunit beta-like [Anguilla anguilla]|uniref:interleukin-2 receptor subunit beta-like n=1 Tax=Anguilla anguilla TaxID=7936 RepID=UPI0015B1BD5A|nr:interleukin-2 receptor subunit beta-like [Anguilla anguilla]
MMEVLWRRSLFLLLAVQMLPCHSLHDLTCFNDYIKKISCVWNGFGTPPEVHCVLKAKAYGNVKSCELMPAEGEDQAFRTCQLAFEVFTYYNKLTIHVVCGDSEVACLKDYRPAHNVKMHPPGKPIVVKSNVSWSLGSPHSNLIPSYNFELQYKRSEQPWENAVSRNLTAKQMSVELPEDELEKGRLYEARVRVKPPEPRNSLPALRGVWSSWSPTASWRSEVGRSPERASHPGSFPGLGPELQVTLGLVTAAVAFLVLITCKIHRAGWVYKWKLPHVPNPSTYFQSLNSVHGGNFQKWLSPMYAPESFDIPQSFEDISAVEVFKTEDVAALLHTSNPTDLWDSSAGSSCFSNMGYFYSEYPDSYGTEVHFSYQMDARCSVEVVGEEGDAPVPARSSYEHLSDHPGKSRQLDPGRREQNEEEEKEGDIGDGSKEIDTVPPLAILPFSLPNPVTPSPIPLPPHLLNMPLLPLPSHDFDSDTATGSSNAPGPLEGALGRSSSERIEPSSGGYMSVMEMLNTYCNKSI